MEKREEVYSSFWITVFWDLVEDYSAAGYVIHFVMQRLSDYVKKP
jgi:hypothetical protein